MERGYIKLWRKLLDSGLLMNGPAWQVFGYLMLKASHKDASFLMAGTAVNILAGQAIIGRKKAADDLGLSEQNIRTALKLLEKLEIINQQPTNKYTVVSFVNWHTYQHNQPAGNQQPNQQVTSNQPAGNQQVTTSKEFKHLSIEDSKDIYVPSGTDHTPIQQIVDLYHQHTTLPRAKVITDTRKKLIKARHKDVIQRLKGKGVPEPTQEQCLNWWAQYFQKVAQSGFLNGQSKEGWAANFDFCVNGNKFVKIIEGAYLENQGR